MEPKPLSPTTRQHCNKCLFTSRVQVVSSKLPVILQREGDSSLLALMPASAVLSDRTHSLV